MKKTLFLITILSTLAMGASLTQKVTLNRFLGEFSPLMNARVDFPQYRMGAKTLQNFMVRAQGPIQRRSGTKYIASVKDATDETRLIPFTDSNDFIVEIGDGYARFFTDGAPVTDPNSSGDPQEVDTPWDANDVFELQYATAEGSMRIVHGDYEPYILTRPDDTNDANWTCAAIDSTTGPFLDENRDTDWTLKPSATTGTDIDLVSSDNLFDDPGHEGALFQLSSTVESNTESKEFSEPHTTGSEESGSITVYKYQYFDVATSGSWWGDFYVQKSYDAGSTWEEVYGVTYRYTSNVLYSGQELEETCIYRMQMVGLYRTTHNIRHYEGTCVATLTTRPMTYNGTVEITSVTDANNAVADVKITLASTDATWRWAEGAWSSYQGYPRVVEYHEQRILYASTKRSSETIWSSIIAEEDSDYDDFTANTESDIEGNLGGPDDIAWKYKFPGMGKAQWLRSGKFLFAGTEKGVMMLGQPGRPITPNYPPIARMQNYNACAYMQPASAASAILYVEKGKQKIRELGYTNTRDAYIAPDMTELAEHITGSGIIDITFQNRPDPILWCVRNDGVLLSFAYRRLSNVMAWGRHTTGTGDEFDSVAKIPGSTEDELWTIVDREVGTFVEQFQPFDWSLVSTTPDQNDCYFVDSGTASLSGNTHLEGESVALWADGRTIGTYTVASGIISPTGSYTNTTVGLPFTSIYETMPIVLMADGGPIMGEYSEVVDLKVDFYESLGCHIGIDTTNAVDWEFSDDSFATTLDVVSEIKVAPDLWGSNRQLTIVLFESDPSPLCFRGLFPKVRVEFD